MRGEVCPNRGRSMLMAQIGGRHVTPNVLPEAVPPVIQVFSLPGIAF